MGEAHYGIIFSIFEIENRKAQGLQPKPIDRGELLAEIIAQIKDTAHPHRADRSIISFIIPARHHQRRWRQSTVLKRLLKAILRLGKSLLNLRLSCYLI